MMVLNPKGLKYKNSKGFKKYGIINTGYDVKKQHSHSDETYPHLTS